MELTIVNEKTKQTFRYLHVDSVMAKQEVFIVKQRKKRVYFFDRNIYTIKELKLYAYCNSKR